MNKARFEAFSDGVYAFASTLLVLNFALPDQRLTGNHDLTRTLLKMWPDAIAYGLSFGVIGIMWQNHHALYRMVERIDRRTVFWNLLLMAATAFLPFATRTLGSYPAMPSAAFLYGLVCSGAAVCYNGTFEHLVKAKAFRSDVTDAVLNETRRAYRTGLAVYFSATLVAVVFPLVSVAAYIAVALYYFIPRGVDSDI